MINSAQKTSNPGLQANLALALAFFPIFLLNALATLLIPEAMHAFGVWFNDLELTFRLTVFVLISMRWLLPALLIFVLLRMTQFERWLKLNVLAHIGLFIANLTIVSFTALVIYHGEYLPALHHARDQMLFFGLAFGAFNCVLNMLWHYVRVLRPALQGIIRPLGE